MASHYFSMKSPCSVLKSSDSPLNHHDIPIDPKDPRNGAARRGDVLRGDRGLRHVPTLAASAGAAAWDGACWEDGKTIHQYSPWFY